MYKNIYLILCFIVCGYFPPTLAIIGGNSTSIRNFPYQVSLQYLGIHQCGGTIISENLILTTGSCADELIENFYHVVAGSTSLKTASVKIGVEQTIVHENYSEPDNDIAVLKLKSNLTFSDDIQPVKLPEQGEEPKANEDVTISGYGVTTAWKIFNPNTLQSANMSVVDRNECQKNYGETEYIITNSMLCAGVRNKAVDICRGDSGGPLTQNGTIVGIASWSTCAQPGYPGVYTRVGAYRDWIKQQTGI